MSLSGTALKCDCCEREKLGEIHLGSVEIQDRRHGQRHIVTIGARDILERIAGTTTQEGILHYVKGVLN